ncbi:MAG: hypothetical protein AB6733_00200 [Clostridiaceae bacterium]
MVYLPCEWIRNKKNENKILELLDELDSDVSDYDPDEKFKNTITQLIDLGENDIAEKLKNNQIPLGA